MKKFRFVTLLLLMSLVLSLFASAAPKPFTEEMLPTAPPAPMELNYPNDLAIEAEAYALVELKSNAILYSKELDAQRYPTSLTKIMTCMLAIQYGDLTDVLTVTPTALDGLSIYGSTAGLVVEEQLALEDLLYCIMLSSANEGCNIIAEYISGDIATFVELMNRTAKALGMNSTQFANTHGLHDEAHYTTVRDLITLSRWAWENETFRRFATATSYTVPATNKSDARTLHTTNYLVSTDVNSRYYYANASGIKTGFTTPAGGCLISTATEGDAEYLSILMGCESAKNATDKRFSETRRLFRHALETYSFVQILTDSTMLAQPEVKNAQGRGDVVVHAKENRRILLPHDYATEDIVIKLRYNEELTAPLKKGQVIGTAIVEYKGIALAESDLVTLTAVEAQNRTPDQGSEEEPGEENPSLVSRLFSRLWRVIRIPLFLIGGLALLYYIALCILSYIRRKRRAKLRRQRRQRIRRHDA